MEWPFATLINNLWGWEMGREGKEEGKHVHCMVPYTGIGEPAAPPPPPPSPPCDLVERP